MEKKSTYILKRKLFSFLPHAVVGIAGVEWTGNGECTVLYRSRNAKELKRLALFESGVTEKTNRRISWKNSNRVSSSCVTVQS